MAASVIQKLKDLNIIQKGSFVLKSGKTSDLYIDMRRAYGHPEILNEIADELIEKIPSDATCIACSGLGGISLGTVLSQKTNLNLTLLRDKPKEHGIGKNIEGYRPTISDKIVIVDDVFSSGTGVSKIIENLKETESTILKILVIVKRGENKLKQDLDFLYTEEDLSSAL